MSNPETNIGTEEKNEGISNPNMSFEEVDRGIEKNGLDSELQPLLKEIRDSTDDGESIEDIINDKESQSKDLEADRKLVNSIEAKINKTEYQQTDSEFIAEIVKNERTGNTEALPDDGVCAMYYDTVIYDEKLEPAEPIDKWDGNVHDPDFMSMSFLKRLGLVHQRAQKARKINSLRKDVRLPAMSLKVVTPTMGRMLERAAKSVNVGIKQLSLEDSWVVRKLDNSTDNPNLWRARIPTIITGMNREWEDYAFHRTSENAVLSISDERLSNSLNGKINVYEVFTTPDDNGNHSGAGMREFNSRLLDLEAQLDRAHQRKDGIIK